MATSKVTYEGNLRTTCTHLKSGESIITDAPIDNNGKGEAFSPTDLVATALGSCSMTVVGVYCNTHNVAFKHGEVEVTKVMGSDPRRIVEVHLKFDFSGNGWNEKTQKVIKRVVETCPVAKSIHPSIEVFIDYGF
jgi:uncharacterized OsmC-like protein